MPGHRRRSCRPVRAQGRSARVCYLRVCVCVCVSAVCSGLPASPRVLTRPSEARDRSGRRDSGRNSCGRTGGRRSVQRAAATERGVCDGNGDAIELWHGAGAVAVAHALHAATHGLAGAGVQDKAAGCRQWTDCSEGAVALRCAASLWCWQQCCQWCCQSSACARRSSRQTRRPMGARRSREASARQELGRRQARRGASRVMAGAGATPTEKKFAIIRFGSGGWQRANRRGRWQVKHK